MILYHATYISYLDSILDKGLIPNYKNVWKISKKYVYLATSPKDALSFAESAFASSQANLPFDYNETICILKINTRKLDIDKLAADENMILSSCEDTCSFQYDGIIPPCSINVHSILTSQDRINKLLLEI